MSNVFERIKHVAQIRGMNLREVAKKAGFKSETGIYRYNQGVTPRDSTLKSIAEVLNTTPEYLKGKTDNIESISKTYFRIDTSDLNPDEINDLYNQLNKNLNSHYNYSLQKRLLKHKSILQFLLVNVYLSI